MKDGGRKNMKWFKLGWIMMAFMSAFILNPFQFSFLEVLSGWNGNGTCGTSYMNMGQPSHTFVLDWLHMNSSHAQEMGGHDHHDGHGYVDEGDGAAEPVRDPLATPLRPEESFELPAPMPAPDDFRDSLINDVQRIVDTNNACVERLRGEVSGLVKTVEDLSTLIQKQKEAEEKSEAKAEEKPAGDEKLVKGHEDHEDKKSHRKRDEEDELFQETEDFAADRFMSELFDQLDESYGERILSEKVADLVFQDIDDFTEDFVDMYKSDRKRYNRERIVSGLDGGLAELKELLEEGHDDEDDDADINKRVYFDAARQKKHIGSAIRALEDEQYQIEKNIKRAKVLEEPDRVLALTRKMDVNDLKLEALYGFEKRFRKKIKSPKHSEPSSSSMLAGGVMAMPNLGGLGAGLDASTIELMLQSGVMSQQEIEALLGMSLTQPQSQGDAYQFGIGSTPYGGVTFNFDANTDDAAWGVNGGYMGDKFPAWYDPNILGPQVPYGQWIDPRTRMTNPFIDPRTGVMNPGLPL